MISPKQQTIIDLLKTQPSMTAAEIALEVGSETKATSKHLRILEAMGCIYVCKWRKGKYGVQTKVYALGDKESVVLVNKRKAKQDEKRKALTQRKAYDPNAPIVPNTGWVSTLYADFRTSNAEHIEFMARFKPHPDPAAAWLFTEVA